MNYRKLFLATALSALVMPTTQAALIGILPATPGGTDYQAYYDDILDITWATEIGLGGAGTWDSKVGGATSVNIAGIGGWRLPSPDADNDGTISFCGPASNPGANCVTNEFDHLFTVSGITQADPGPFIGMPDFPAQFWTSYEQPNNPDGAWFFGFGNGNQTYGDKSVDKYGWAVRDGDASLIPVPAAAWLFASALAMLGWLRRQRL
jgi:hypothetical protein